MNMFVKIDVLLFVLLCFGVVDFMCFVNEGMFEDYVKIEFIEGEIFVVNVLYCFYVWVLW